MACYQVADLCAVRFSLLDTDGSPLCNEPDGTAYTMDPISLQITPTVDAGESVTTRNGCGAVIYTRTDPDVEIGADLVLTLGLWDPELLQLATSGEIAVGPDSLPAFAKGTQTADSVEAHFWGKTFDDSSQVASPSSYTHFVFPSVTWTFGSFSLNRDLLQVVLNGTAVPNGNLGSGGFSDVPVFTDPYWMATFTSDDIPDPATAPYNANGLGCGYVDTPACSSS